MYTYYSTALIRNRGDYSLELPFSDGHLEGCTSHRCRMFYRTEAFRARSPLLSGIARALVGVVCLTIWVIMLYTVVRMPSLVYVCRVYRNTIADLMMYS